MRKITAFTRSLNDWHLIAYTLRYNQEIDTRFGTPFLVSYIWRNVDDAKARGDDELSIDLGDDYDAIENVTQAERILDKLEQG